MNREPLQYQMLTQTDYPTISLETFICEIQLHQFNSFGATQTVKEALELIKLSAQNSLIKS